MGGDAKKVTGSFFDSKKLMPETMDPLRPEMRPLAGDLASYARGLVGREGTPYGGRFTAPMTSGESSILSRINMIAGGDGANASPLGRLAFGPQREALISDILSGNRLRPETNPFLAENIDYLRGEGTKNLGANLDLVDAAFGRAGLPSGSGRSREAIETARLSTRDLNNTISSFLGDQYNRGLGEQYNTLSSVVPNIDAFNSTMLFNALGANALPRQIEQQNLDSLFREFLRLDNAPNANAQLALSILGGTPGMQFVQPQYQPSVFSQILGAAGDAGQAALPFLLI